MEVLIMAASAPTCMMSNMVPHLLPMVNGGGQSMVGYLTQVSLVFSEIFF